METLFKKISRKGWGWAIRRAIREILQPRTRAGQCLLPLRWLVRILLVPFNRAVSSTAKDTLFFMYDLDVEPITYDFWLALVIAEAKRCHLGLSFLQVVIVPGRVAGLRDEAIDYDAIIDQSARRWRIFAMLLESLPLLAVQPSLVYCATREQARTLADKIYHSYPDNYLWNFPTVHQKTDVKKYSPSVVVNRAPAEAHRYVQMWLNSVTQGRKVIVITLRQYAYVEARNSQVEEWGKFIRKLNQQDYCVVIVPDTEAALTAPPAVLAEHALFFTAACWNVALRVALYESAYLNLGVNTGPLSLCWFNPRCRYLMFKLAVKGEVVAVTREHGYGWGETPKFATKYQKWIWEDDDEEVITREFLSMMNQLSVDAQLNVLEPTLI